ncbi:uncharacterized protein [Antedon mediterranea]|uniref:uncharacterized protein n=1 Tax=Antedon mediterranea TaxID=105859 RepID=UPI003AF7CEC6
MNTDEAQTSQAASQNSTVVPAIPETTQNTGNETDIPDMVLDKISVEIGGKMILMHMHDWLAYQKIEMEKEKLELERKKIEYDREIANKTLARDENVETIRAQIQRESNDGHSTTSSYASTKIDRYKQKLTNNIDADAYFTAFESYAKREQWEESTWVRRISQCIEGKARDSMNTTMDENFDYETLKCTILEVFQLTPEHYRQKFRNLKRNDNESIRSYITKVGHNFDCWVRYSGIAADDAAGISQLIIREQVLENIPNDMRQHLLQKKVLNTADFAREAEEYASIIPNYWQRHKLNNKQIGTNSHYRPQPYNSKPPRFDRPTYNRPRFNPPPSAPNHSAFNRPATNPQNQHQFRPNFNASYQQDLNSLNRQFIPQQPPRFSNTQGRQNQNQRQKNQRPHDSLKCITVHSGSSKTEPLNKAFLINGILEGKAITFLRDTGSSITLIDKQFIPQKSLTENVALDFKESLDYNLPNTPEAKSLLHSDIKDLIKLQEKDETLKFIRSEVKDKSCTKDQDVCFYKENGIIMRKCQPQTRFRKQIDDQIVVPQEYREHIINIAHDKTGRLGVQKTQDRITQHFYWPGINHQVREHCKTCPQCQYLTKTKKQKQLLRPLPIIDIPFKRIGIDIAGPFCVTEDGNRYLLVLCDYATRYPEAIPIPDQTAVTVAQSLITVLSRVGLPSQIIHDQGTNFMSQIIVELCKKLGIEKIPTTPYHQQTNGLTERFIGTLKLMINSLSHVQRENWDRYIPLLLFSYREVPCEFTGYSPFHLLYGRQIRGPLSLIKQGFLGENTQTDIPSHLLGIAHNLTKWMASANHTKQKKQQKMKSYYDRTAKDIHYKVGEEVLIFLPEGAGKLDSKWQGPYKITKKVGEVDYEIHMPDKRKSHRIIHANLIKKWYTQEDARQISQCYCVTGVIQEIGNESLVQPVDYDLETQFLDDSIGPSYKQTQTWKDVKIADSISTKQKRELTNTLKKHTKAFSDVPGKTNVLTHTVKTTHETPIRQRAYRTPHSMMTKVKEEVDSMLSLGVIERSTSAYASPIVVVPKPNGDIRVCTDYRALNKITEFDPYPIPRIDQILDEVAKAKYISTLDLTKGFYQVPLDPQAKAKSAFVTPFGQFAYRVMPFGMMNSSATFQKLVDTVLMGCSAFCRQYIDDIAIFSNTWQDHLNHLDIVLSKISEAGLTIKPSKSKFANSTVNYLGHTIGDGQIKPMLDKIESVEKFPTPQTKKNVRSFLGLTGYYRKFILHYDDIARPLINLTKKAEPKRVNWTPECDKAFTDLKSQLIAHPILRAPNFDKPFLLQTDASKTGIGAVLSQLDTDCNEHPIVYLSRRMLPNELNYSVAEQECLAIVWSINKLRYYLQGHKFTVITDHKALKWLNNTRHSNNRLIRWSKTLQQFTFDIQYRKGITNTNADSLSRRC